MYLFSESRCRGFSTQLIKPQATALQTVVALKTKYYGELVQ